MQISDFLTLKGKTIAVCTGGDITPETKCSQFVQNGKRFNTQGSSLGNSLTGILQLFLLLPNANGVQRGEIRIIN